MSFLLQGDTASIPVMLVGNKNDEAAELREVSHAEGIYILYFELNKLINLCCVCLIKGVNEAAAWGVQFMETSAKTNYNVTELFQVSLQINQSLIRVDNLNLTILRSYSIWKRIEMSH